MSVSVPFALLKMRAPFLLVLFHRTLLDGIGKKQGLQHYTLHGQTVIVILQGKVGCRLSPELDCSCC